MSDRIDSSKRLDLKSIFKKINQINSNYDANIIHSSIKFTLRNKFSLKDFFEDIELNDTIIYIRYTNAYGMTGERIHWSYRKPFVEKIVDLFFKGVIMLLKINDKIYKIKLFNKKYGTIRNISKYSEIIPIKDYINVCLHFVFATGNENIIDMEIKRLHILYKNQFDIGKFIYTIYHKYQSSTIYVTDRYIKLRQNHSNNLISIIEMYSNVVMIRTSSAYHLLLAHKYVDNIIEMLESIKYLGTGSNIY